ncbi:cell envelope integrity protein TolA [Chlamydiifrater volucris]|uniref:cell envelope integrity protein TolA n=1 Tax=Chlamydiifrater volucris TaxID=2681470 RepID=UPI001FE2AB85|nr:hypothetical protein [Chlamydiifrater volucris]
MSVSECVESASSAGISKGKSLFEPIEKIKSKIRSVNIIRALFLICIVFSGVILSLPVAFGIVGSLSAKSIVWALLGNSLTLTWGIVILASALIIFLTSIGGLVASSKFAWRLYLKKEVLEDRYRILEVKKPVELSSEEKLRIEADFLASPHIKESVKKMELDILLKRACLRPSEAAKLISRVYILWPSQPKIESTYRKCPDVGASHRCRRELRFVFSGFFTRKEMLGLGDLLRKELAKGDIFDPKFCNSVYAECVKSFPALVAVEAAYFVWLRGAFSYLGRAKEAIFWNKNYRREFLTELKFFSDKMDFRILDWFDRFSGLIPACMAVFSPNYLSHDEKNLSSTGVLVCPSTVNWDWNYYCKKVMEYSNQTLFLDREVGQAASLLEYAEHGLYSEIFRKQVITFDYTRTPVNFFDSPTELWEMGELCDKDPKLSSSIDEGLEKLRHCGYLGDQLIVEVQEFEKIILGMQKKRSSEEFSDLETSSEAPSEKAPSEKAPSEKAPSEKAPSEKAPSEKAPSEKAPSEKAPSEKAPSEKAPSEKAPSEKAPSEKAPSIEDRESPTTESLFEEELEKGALEQSLLAEELQFSRPLAAGTPIFKATFGKVGDLSEEGGAGVDLETLSGLEQLVEFSEEGIFSTTDVIQKQSLLGEVQSLTKSLKDDGDLLKAEESLFGPDDEMEPVPEKCIERPELLEKEEVSPSSKTLESTREEVAHDEESSGSQFLREGRRDVVEEELGPEDEMSVLTGGTWIVSTALSETSEGVVEGEREIVEKELSPEDEMSVLTGGTWVVRAASSEVSEGAEEGPEVIATQEGSTGFQLSSAGGSPTAPHHPELTPELVRKIEWFFSKSDEGLTGGGEKESATVAMEATHSPAPKGEALSPIDEELELEFSMESPSLTEGMVEALDRILGKSEIVTSSSLVTSPGKVSTEASEKGLISPKAPGYVFVKDLKMKEASPWQVPGRVVSCDPSLDDDPQSREPPRPVFTKSSKKERKFSILTSSDLRGKPEGVRSHTTTEDSEQKKTPLKTSEGKKDKPGVTSKAPRKSSEASKIPAPIKSSSTRRKLILTPSSSRRRIALTRKGSGFGHPSKAPSLEKVLERSGEGSSEETIKEVLSSAGEVVEKSQASTEEGFKKLDVAMGVLASLFDDPRVLSGEGIEIAATSTGGVEAKEGTSAVDSEKSSSKDSSKEEPSASETDGKGS